MATAAKKDPASAPSPAASEKKVASATKTKAPASTTAKKTVAKSAVEKIKAVEVETAKATPVKAKPVKKTAVKESEPEVAAPLQTTVSPELRQHMIATAAYFLAERRGFSAGHDVHDWIAAEIKIDAQLKP